MKQIEIITMKSLLVLYSYHHNNTEKIAKVIAEVLDAQIQTPQQVSPEKLQDYDLIGFGSGIYGEKHHDNLLNLADRLPRVSGKKAFIFSTSGIAEAAKNHSLLRDKLRSRGYIIVDEFNCRGFNTNSFLELFGGMNKGRPNFEDLEKAMAFASNLKRCMC